MKVAINGRFKGRNLSGVDRYATEIATRLGNRARLVAPRRQMGGARGHAWEQLVLPLLVRPGEILWSPANSGPLAATRHVVTIHDLSVLDHPNWFAPHFAMWYGRLIPRLAARAQHVLTVSEHSRSAIIRQLGLEPARVTAVPNAVDLSRFRRVDAAAVRRKYDLRGAYGLFVGSIDPRKNLARLVQAWEQVRLFEQVELVIVGTSSSVFRPVQIERRQPGVRFLGYVPDEDLAGLYSGAAFFIMPSLFEGFGLPVLEAMACGTPVIASTSGALPEVVGNAALPIDPRSIDQMTEAMRALLTDKNLGSQLSRIGLERARDFSWGQSAERVWEVLSSHVQ